MDTTDDNKEKKNKELFTLSNISPQAIAFVCITLLMGFLYGANPFQKFTISILKAIDPGKSKDEYIKILENNIYSELDLLN